MDTSLSDTLRHSLSEEAKLAQSTLARGKQIAFHKTIEKHLSIEPNLVSIWR